MTEHEMEFEDLEAMVDPSIVEALEGPLGKLTQEVDILLFVAPGCAVCPHQVRTVAALTLASPLVAAEIVDVSLEPEVAAQYEVRAVPTTVVNDELVVVGAKAPLQMAELLLAREGPEGEKALLASLAESGRIEEAADRILYGPDTGAALGAFLDLWSRSALQDRIGLSLVAEEVLDQNQEGLDPLIPLLAEELRGDGPLTQDPSRLGDTADLLGKIGHADARPLLEALARSSNAEVVEAARDALEDLG